MGTRENKNAKIAYLQHPRKLERVRYMDAGEIEARSAKPFYLHWIILFREWGNAKLLLKVV